MDIRPGDPLHNPGDYPFPRFEGSPLGRFSNNKCAKAFPSIQQPVDLPFSHHQPTQEDRHRPIYMAVESHSKSSPEGHRSFDDKQRVEHVASARQRSPAEERGHQHMSWHTWMALLSLLLAFNGYLFTQIMPAAVLAYINAELGPDTNYVWISVA
jgi:hypothetical protein